MKEIRKGNDIVVTWSLKREGEPFILEGLSLTLYLKSMYDKEQLSDYSVSGNKIIWTFYGKDQTHTGNYSLELVANKDEKGMMTTDACNFVRIVSCSCRTSNGWDDCGIKTEVVDIESEVEYGGSIIVVDKVLSPDSENAIANSAVWNGLKQVKDSIPSLSEYAKKEDIHTPDWNAGEGEEGHIKNRTHYADFVEVDIPEDIASSEVELTIPNIVGAPILVHYAILSTSKYLKISPNDKELHVLSYGPAFKIRRGDGNTIFVSGHNDENHRLYIATHFVALNEIFLPETIARKSEIQNKLTELEDEVASNGVLIEDLQNMKIDKENDDYYPKMAVGLADNLSGVDVVDSEINFRRSGGGAISDGVARIEAIKGNSVVWNQLANGAATLSLLSSHKYMTIIGNVAAIETNIATLDVAEGDRVYDLTQMFGAGNEPTTIEEFYARIPMGIDEYAHNEGEVIHMDVQSIELQGVNAFDEVWEQGGISNAGKDDPVFMDVIKTKHIEVLGGETYYAHFMGDKLYLKGFFYDKTGNFIGSSNFDMASTYADKSFLAPQDAVSMRMRIYSASGDLLPEDAPQVCINISDTSINGKYFPYIKRVEDLSIIRKYFPDGMKSAPTAHDEIRYNKESGKWEKVEAIGTRAYQEGDAEDATLLTDGKVTCYPLAEPIVTELDEADQFKDLDYQVWNAGTEKAIAEGKSAPLAADITYGFNAIGKIKELESLVAALRAKVGI